MNSIACTPHNPHIVKPTSSSIFNSGFNAKEKDYESGYHYYGARYYESELLTGWLSVDPMADKYPSQSPYNYCAWTRPTGGDEHRWIKYNIVNNPVKLVDPDGRIPFPLKIRYNNWTIKVDSWYGPRNTNIPGASTFHRGLDLNYSGGGDTDYGSPILATHEGIATIDDNPDGKEGRSVVITSPDGSFRTRYFHLSKINIQDGDYVSESEVIAEMGGSANGNEHGRTSHLHYEIQEKRGANWVSIDPSKTGKHNMDDIYDPQTWIPPSDRKNNSIIQPIFVPQDILIKVDNTRCDNIIINHTDTTN